MDDYESLKHTRRECRYHIVLIPKCRRQKLYQQLRQHLGEVFRQSVQQRESQILEGRLIVDHVHMLISIPPRYAVAQVIGYIKGKRTIQIARTVGGTRRDFTGGHFWAWGYFVSTVGRDEKAIREYIQRQEQEDRRLDQMRMKSGDLEVLLPGGVPVRLDVPAGIDDRDLPLADQLYE